MGGLQVGEKLSTFKNVVKTDTTTNRVKNFIVEGAPSFPRAAGHYFLDKVPIVQWLPRYHPSWLVQDFVAGLTIGVILIPQGLAYAKIATIPIENGLYSSWIPAAVGVFMGTSKDLSSGPTSVLGLLTAEIIRGFGDQYAPAAIASAVALMIGIYSLILGLLGLGFLLDYVSVPVLTGFVSATSLTIGFGQLGSLVGLDNTPSAVFDIIGDALRRLPKWNGPTCGIGFGTIAMLLALEKAGKLWGKKHFLIKYMASSRAVIVLLIFTIISYLVNKDRKTPLWGLAKVSTHGIATPTPPNAALLSEVASRSFAPLVACTLEHLAVGKAFGRKNNYELDQTQELSYLGVSNIINSFFQAMPTGGAMSRTAVNSECGVRSPLNQAATAGWILLTIYVFSPALFWIPKATLAAIIIMAVLHLFGPVSLFYRYWRVSLADFIASMLSFWITLLVSAEYGIGLGVAWSIVWSLLRSAFASPKVEALSPPASDGGRPRHVFYSETDMAAAAAAKYGGAPSNPIVPDDVVVAHFTDSIFFPNAYRGKGATVRAVQLVYDSAATAGADRDRSWSVAAERAVERARRVQGVAQRSVPLGVVVFDCTAVSWIDVTGVLAMGELKDDVRRHCGPDVLFRFVGLNAGVRQRFDRARWPLTEFDEPSRPGVDVLYPTLESAVGDNERAGSVLDAVVVGEKNDEYQGLKEKGG